MANVSENEFGRDHNLMNEVICTGRKVGADREFWRKLAHDQELFERVVAVGKGEAEVTLYWLSDSGPVKIIPSNSEVFSNQHKGKFLWHEHKAYLTNQHNGEMLNANMLRHFELKPYLIPKDWEGPVVFSGTVFCDSKRKKEKFWLCAMIKEHKVYTWYAVETSIKGMLHARWK
jgi:hypothetical protein